MTNGTGAYQQPETHHEIAPAVVQVNFGLKPRHIVVAFSAMGAALASLATAGWLALPAKQVDLDAVKTQLTTMQTTVVGLQDNVTDLTAAIDDLVVNVRALRTPTVRRSTRKRRTPDAARP